MKTLLTLLICLACCTSQAQNVKQARKQADSLAQAAKRNYHFVRQYTAPTPSDEVSFIYESPELDSSRINWQVVKIHQQSGIMDKGFKAPHRRMNVVFRKDDKQHYTLYTVK